MRRETVWARRGGDPAFSATVTVRARATQPWEEILGFLEPGWGVREPYPPRGGQRQFVIQARDEDGLARLLEAAAAHRQVLACQDRLWTVSAGGRIQVRSRIPVGSAADLTMAYTPGVARLATRIAADPQAAWEVTGRRNRVAVVSDGTSVLDLGAVGPLAALPVMEGKAALLARLAGIDAVPLCLDATDVDQMVAAVRVLAPSFGAVCLAGVAAPACFTAQRRLQRSLKIPVFGDEEHGTAIVVLAALRTALSVIGKDLSVARIVIIGTGPAAAATARLLARTDATDVIIVGKAGVLDAEDESLPPYQRGIASMTNPRRVIGGLTDALAGADAVIGLSPKVPMTRGLVASMADAPIVFALADREPELRAELLDDVAAVLATGRPDYPNQLVSALAYPGVLRGALDGRATRITPDMHLAAADALTGLIAARASATRLLPDVLDPAVVPTVAAAVAARVPRAAHRESGEIRAGEGIAG
ncbi:NAD(P)-dependent malic enzyme [Longispora urticae]